MRKYIILALCALLLTSCSLREFLAGGPTAEQLAAMQDRVVAAEALMAEYHEKYEAAMVRLENASELVGSVGGEAAQAEYDDALEAVRRLEEDAYPLVLRAGEIARAGLQAAEDSGGGWLGVVSGVLGVLTVVAGGKWAMALRLARGAVSAAEVYRDAGDAAAETADAAEARRIMESARDAVRKAQTADHTRDGILRLREKVAA